MKICSVCHRCYEDAATSCALDRSSLITGRSGTRRMIANYELNLLLERDAVSEIYEATNVKTNESYAVKILTPLSVIDLEEVRKQFQNETQAAVSINHPHIIRVDESGSLGSSEFYFVTESLSGETLDKYLRDAESLSEAEALIIARQTAEALEAAHSAGVIHRAVNPANIILDRDEQNGFAVKLRNFDFGSINQQAVINQDSDGKLPSKALDYLSPEQRTGQTVDSRTDVYSLGLALYEMLCGSLPFEDSASAALVDKQINEQPLIRLHFDTRALLTHLLKHSLKKSPSARLQTAANFVRQLRQVERALPKSAQTWRGIQHNSLPKQALPSGATAIAKNESVSEPDRLLIEQFEAYETNSSLKPVEINEAPTPALINQVVEQPPPPVSEVAEEILQEIPQEILEEIPEEIREEIAEEVNSSNIVPVLEPQQIRAQKINVDLFVTEPIAAKRKETNFAPFESAQIFGKKKPVDKISPKPAPILVESKKANLVSAIAETVVSPTANAEEARTAQTAVTPSSVNLFGEYGQPSLASRSKWLLLIGVGIMAVLVLVAWFYNPQLQQSVSQQLGFNANSSNQETQNQSQAAPDVANAQTELNASFSNWLAATNARDVNQQMSFYAPKVKTYYRYRNASSDSVRAEKKRVFDRASSVDIQASQPEIVLTADEQNATMRFNKKYAINQGSRVRAGEVIQELQWTKSSDGWKIISERDVKVIKR